MNFCILGSVDASGEDGPIALGGPRQRAVLAVLLLRAPKVVSRDSLIAAVWGLDAPETAATALHGHVSTLRKALGNDRIVTQAPGYALHAGEDEIDLARFERLAADGGAALAGGDALAARAALTAALALWRGEPLEGVEAAPFVEDERRRLTEERLTTLELRVDADLALGRDRELVAELRALVRENPLRERFRAQLMLALYRSDRQAEALEVYAEGRSIMAAELGLEPGDALRSLQRSILEQDPSIAAPAGPARRRERRHRVLAGVVAAAVIVVAAAAFALTRGSPAPVPVRADSIAIIDPGSNRVSADVQLASRPEAIAVGFGAAWVAQPELGTIARIDTKTHDVRVFGIGYPVRSLATGFGRVWAADGEAGTVSSIDPSTLGHRTFRLGRDPVLWIATSRRSIWVGRRSDVVRFQPDGSDRHYFAVDRPTGIAAGGGVARIFNGDPTSTIPVPAPDAAWVSTEGHDLVRVGRAGSRGTAQLGVITFSPALQTGTVWAIAYLGRGALVPIDATSLELGTPVPVAFPVAVTTGEGAVWAVGANGTVSRVDPVTGRVVAEISTAPSLRAAVAAGDGRVWVAVQSPA